MNYAKIIILALLLFSLTLLNSLNLEFVNGDTLEAKVLKADAEKVYVQHAKTLLIIDRKLILTKIIDKKGKVKFNSFHEIINLENEADLTKIQTLSEPPEPKEKFTLENRNFIYANVSAIFFGMGGGVGYERFVSNHVSVSVGYNQGEILYLFSKYSEVKYSEITIDIKLVPHSNHNISGELGVGGTFWKLEKHRDDSYTGSGDMIVYDENFFPTFNFGMRYQPDKIGITFRAGLRTMIQNNKSLPTLHINLGWRF